MHKKSTLKVIPLLVSLLILTSISSLALGDGRAFIQPPSLESLITLPQEKQPPVGKKKSVNLGNVK